MIAKICQISLLALLAMVFIQPAQALDKDRYRPYQHPYPQVIQHSDYPTIMAIENIVREIKMLPEGSLSCAYDNGVVSVRSDDRIFDITTYANREVLIGEKVYRTRDSVIYFKTLNKMLGELSKTADCKVEYGQFATRGYKTRTIVDFEFGPRVVEVDALSNGPKDEERLYTLDLLKREDAFFTN